MHSQVQVHIFMFFFLPNFNCIVKLKHKIFYRLGGDQFLNKENSGPLIDNLSLDNILRDLYLQKKSHSNVEDRHIIGYFYLFFGDKYCYY